MEVITNEHNMAMMARYPDKFFDLAIVDPPYGIDVLQKGTIGGVKKFGSKSFGVKNTRKKIIKSKEHLKKEWDKEPPNNEYFLELLRVCKHVIIWGANHFISRIPFDSPCWIVWDKDNSGDFADCELAYTNFDSAVRKFKFRWNGMLQQNMKVKEIRIHPTQKPVMLYAWLLDNYAKPGDKILDTHLGSGSSRIAAYKKGFDFYACEIDEDYFADQEKRFKKEIAMPLFDTLI